MNPVEVLRNLGLDQVVPKSTPRNHPLTYIEALAASPKRAGSRQAQNFLRNLQRDFARGETVEDALEGITEWTFHEMVWAGEREQQRLGRQTSRRWRKKR